MLLYTSSTTGKPRAVSRTHVNFLGSMVTRDMCISVATSNNGSIVLLHERLIGWMSGITMSPFILRRQPAGEAEGTHFRYRPLLALARTTRSAMPGVAPTLIRGLMRYGDRDVKPLRPVVAARPCSGGEAWTEAPWRFFKHVCKSTLPFLNIVGTGSAAVISPVPCTILCVLVRFGARGLGAGVGLSA